jgi:hypothetical protein
MITGSTKRNHPDLPKDVMSMLDLGFFEVEKDYPEQRSSLPIKKEKDHELTEVQKEYNRNHSAKRIVIEHGECTPPNRTTCQETVYYYYSSNCYLHLSCYKTPSVSCTLMMNAVCSNYNHGRTCR